MRRGVDEYIFVCTISSMRTKTLVESRRFNIHLEEKQLSLLARACERTGANFSELIRRAIEKVYGGKEKK